MSRRVRLTIIISAAVPHLAPDHTALAALAADLEAWGADQLVLGEHLLQSPDVRHPGVEVDLMVAFPEPLLVLAAAAAATTTIGLATGALIAPTRSPLIVAKAAATLDVLSGGRFELGITAGWFEREFTAIGVAFDERFARLDETVAVCRAVWGEPPVSYHGRWTSFDNMYCLPRPLRGAETPIWFGGRASARSARRVAQCEGWIVSEAADHAEIRRGVDAIAAACAVAGRSVSDIGVRATVPRHLPFPASDGTNAIAEFVLTEARALVGIGVTDVCVPLPEYTADRAQAEELVGRLVVGWGAVGAPLS
jgi:probable F420-dependent oxidoreductase